MTGYKYFKFMVDNDGDPTRIAKAMKRLDVNLASDLDVSLIMYGLRFHRASGKAILEGCVHFYDDYDGYELALDMPEFNLWGSTEHEFYVIDQFLCFHPCMMFTKLGCRNWNSYGVGVIKIETVSYYTFEI